MVQGILVAKVRRSSDCRGIGQKNGIEVDRFGTRHEGKRVVGHRIFDRKLELEVRGCGEVLIDRIFSPKVCLCLEGVSR